MTTEEKIQLQQLQSAVTNMAIELVELKKSLAGPDVEPIGRASGGVITLQELEATVKVLKSYKHQGFTKIEL